MKCKINPSWIQIENIKVEVNKTEIESDELIYNSKWKIQTLRPSPYHDQKLDVLNLYQNKEKIAISLSNCPYQGQRILVASPPDKKGALYDATFYYHNAKEANFEKGKLKFKFDDNDNNILVVTFLVPKSSKKEIKNLVEVFLKEKSINYGKKRVCSWFKSKI